MIGKELKQKHFSLKREIPVIWRHDLFWFCSATWGEIWMETGKNVVFICLKAFFSTKSWFFLQMRGGCIFWSDPNPLFSCQLLLYGWIALKLGQKAANKHSFTLHADFCLTNSQFFKFLDWEGGQVRPKSHFLHGQPAPAAPRIPWKLLKVDIYGIGPLCMGVM